MSSPALPRTLDHSRRTALQDRDDEAATRELAGFLVDGDAATRLEVARALDGHALPPDVRERVAALILDDTLDGEDSFVRWPLNIAARALLEGPPAKVYSMAEPLLRVSGSSRPFARLRADVLVDALETQLALCAATPGRGLPDSRFRALCEEIQRADPSLAFAAAQVIDGFRHFAGEDVQPIARHVGLGEDGDPPFPFLVAGFVIERQEQQRLIAAALAAAARGLPPGLSWFEHQYGGYACMQTTLLGYGLVVPDSPPVAEALRVLSATWYGSSGEPMTPPDLVEWSERLGAGVLPNGAESGAEALLVGCAGAPLETLRGSPVLAFGERGPAWRVYIEVVPEPDITQRGCYGEAHEQALRRIGEACGLGAPRIVLLWGNSD